MLRNTRVTLEAESNKRLSSLKVSKQQGLYINGLLLANNAWILTPPFGVTVPEQTSYKFDYLYTELLWSLSLYVLKYSS